MNSNINFNYDVDYSKDKSIDKRVLEVCAIAEANFLKNLKKTNSRNITDIRDLIINNNNNDNFKIMFANNDTKKALETSRPNVQNRSFFSSSKIGKIGNKSISLEKNLLSQRYYNNNPKNQVNSNFICFKNRLNKQIVNSKNFDQNFSGTKLYLKQNNKLNNENKSFSGISKSQRNFNFRSRMKNQQIERSINLNKKSTIQEELKSNNNFNNFIQTNSSMVRQYKPLFSKTINKSYIFPHIQHIKNKNKYELSKILLKTQNLINRKKYLLAYNLLKEIISTGEYHSDLFYLFGEVNRILKNYQNLQKFFIRWDYYIKN